MDLRRHVLSIEQALQSFLGILIRCFVLVALFEVGGQAPLQTATLASHLSIAASTISSPASVSSIFQPHLEVLNNESGDWDSSLPADDADLIAAYLRAGEDSYVLNTKQRCTGSQSWTVPGLVSLVLSLFDSRPPIATAAYESWTAEPDALEASSWTEENVYHPDTWSATERQLRTIPQYVLDHAPLIHLFSGEEFWPCDIADHLDHVKPFVGYEPLKGDDVHERYNLTDVNQLNRYRPGMFLTSDDNVEDRPEWLSGESNIPEEPIPPKHGKTDEGSLGGRSDAPVTVIVIDKGNGVVDAFYHFFYCYNLGPKVLNVRFGNHIGDWEHTVVRFRHGMPDEVWFSEHVYGQAFKYDALEKIGKRPVGYSATGTHAMYATPGIHRYVLPWGLLQDVTDRGPLWDPLLNMHAYTFNLTERRLRASTLTPKSPTEWFYFIGHWGDKAYPLSDRRQYYFAGQSHYVSGPIGPISKNLGRKDVCIRGKKCDVQKSLSTGGIRRWPGGEKLNAEEERQIRERYDLKDD